MTVNSIQPMRRYAQSATRLETNIMCANPDRKSNSVYIYVKANKKKNFQTALNCLKLQDDQNLAKIHDKP